MCGHGRMYTHACRHMVTVGVPCWTAMCASPVSTPSTARQPLSTSTASPGDGAATTGMPVAAMAGDGSPRATWRTSIPSARNAEATAAQCSAGHTLLGPSVSWTSSTVSARSARGAADSGSGRATSTAIPASAQIRARISLMARGP